MDLWQISRMHPASRRLSAPTLSGLAALVSSGIALVLHERGFVVTGSDLKTSRYIRQLTRAGVDIHVGHDAKTIDEVQPDVVVVSTAIPESNPELIRARELGIPFWPRAKMLSALGHGHTTVAVAGTHGKTTTSSMCATMLDRMGLDPSFLIGGIVEGYDTNGRNGSSEYFVCEADESDSSFLYLDPNVVVVTNVEADHLDHYGSLEEIEATFVKFMKLVGEDGTIIVCGDSRVWPSSPMAQDCMSLPMVLPTRTTSWSSPMPVRMRLAAALSLPWMARSVTFPSRTIRVVTICSTRARPSSLLLCSASMSMLRQLRSPRLMARPSPFHTRGRYARRLRGR